MDDPAESEVRAALADAEDFSGAGLAVDVAKGQPRTLGGQTVPPGMARAFGVLDQYGLPVDCPVIPLGMDAGRFFFLNTLGQVVSLTELKAEKIKGMFAGRIDYLYWWAPRRKAPPKEVAEQGEEAIKAFFADPDNVNGWDANVVGDALYNACAMKGVWRDFELVRGRGAWREYDGSLTVHCGNALYSLDRKSKMIVRPPGDYGDAVYPAGPRRPAPWAEPVSVKPGRDLNALLRTWNWRRDIDADLLQGWIGAGMLGGALHWRPSFFLTGPRGTGKSSVTRRVLRELFGEGAIYATNATAAGLYQHIMHDACPVILDQFEADANSAKSKAVIELARDSCSDGVVMRGGAEHKGVEFKARNCFGFAAIRRPAMRPEDRSRMVFLQLDPFEPGAIAPALDRQELQILGRKLLRRLMDRWADYDAVLTSYHRALMAVGHDSRGADQFGVLLACADMLTQDEMPDADSVAEKAAMLAPEGMAEFIGQVEEWERCLIQMMSAPVPAWKSGSQPSVGAVLAAFMSEDQQVRIEAFGDLTRAGELKKANTLLASAGLKIETGKREYPGVAFWLSVPSADDKLRSLFEDSDFGGESGVEGAWAGALQQAARYDPETRQGMWVSERSTLDGRRRWCTWLRMDEIVGTDDGDEDADPGGTDPPF
ncbi:hypothetical protein [Maricaulis sp.]|uniref:hypothetical protein n=1 Tax=Maricaulis sp. TaxID=1486257 RepID=UPI003296E3B2